MLKTHPAGSTVLVLIIQQCGIQSMSLQRFYLLLVFMNGTSHMCCNIIEENTANIKYWITGVKILRFIIYIYIVY